jgi:hypothetical protein
LTVNTKRYILYLTKKALSNRPVDFALPHRDKEESMRKSSFIASIAFMVCFMLQVDLWAGPPPNNWNKVKGLSKGAKLTVTLKEGGTYYGSFVKLSDKSIFIMEENAKQQLEFPKSSVLRISERRPAETVNLKQSTIPLRLLMAGACGGVGFGIGYGYNSLSQDPVGDPVKMGAILGGISAGACSVIGGIGSNNNYVHLPAEIEVIFESQ